MPNHRPEAVANMFLELAGDKGLTQLQIQKLTYIAHGWTLALYDQPLTNELPQAWDMGPVYSNLRQRLAHVGANSVHNKIREYDHYPSTVFSNRNGGKEISADFSETEADIIRQVWDIYGSLSGFELSNLTHLNDSAWYRTYNEYGRNKEISNSLTKEHYKKLATEGSTQENS